MPGSSSKKQSQRTKGNTKPSSSSHAAELLNSAGTAPTGFVGFGQSPKYVPASNTLEHMDTSLDPDFRMILRKLTKKDATTKIKGLQEFSELCGEKSDDSLKAVLPFWPRTYNKMTMDVDYRVREAAQQAMSTLVLRVRRNLAPYLKSLMGAWLLSQCDTYPTVASSAQMAFQNTFPPVKQTEVLVFCKDSILEYLKENLITHTPQSLSDPKTTDPDDMENKYNRVITASLLAIRKLLNQIPANEIQSLKEPLTTLLENPKFWKHGKSKVCMVKGAMYCCLSGLCQSDAELCLPYVNKMAPLVLHNLEEKDPAICTYLWEAVLSLVNFVPDCWKHINVQKAFWPKLKIVLEGGCSGNAVVIGPNLLPLVSRIPEDLFPDNNKFYEDFFTSFRLGLSTSPVQKSPSECAAVVKAYMECAQYIVKQNTHRSSSSANLLFDQVVPVIEASLMEKSSPLYKSPLYGMVGIMLTGLEFSDHPASRQTAVQFWNQMKEIVQLKLSSPEELEGGSYFEDRVVYLVKCMFYPQTETKQKTGRVKFENPSENGIVPVASFIDKKQENSVKIKIELAPSARKFVQDITLITFELAHKHFSSTHIRVFSQLIELDSTDQTVAKVIACCHGDVATETTSHYFVFEICIPWLMKLQEKSSSDDFTHLIHIVCIFVPVLDDQSVLTLLDKLFENCTDTRAEYVLYQKLFSISETNPAVHEWVQGKAFGEKLVEKTRAMCAQDMVDDIQEEITNTLAILTLVLATKDHNNELVISSKYIETLLEVFLNILERLSNNGCPDNPEVAISCVAKAAQGFFSGYKNCLTMNAAADLIISLYRVSLCNMYNISENTLDEARSAWCEGITYIVEQTGGLLYESGVLGKIASVTKLTVTSSVNSLTLLSRLMVCVESLLTTVRESLPQGDEVNPVFVSYCQQLTAPVSAAVPTKVWEYMCVKGDYPCVPVSQGDNTFPMEMLFTSLYNCKLLKYTQHTAAVTSHESSSTDVTMETSRGIPWSTERLICLFDIIQGSCVIQNFIEQNKMVSNFPSVLEASSQLSSAARDLVLSLDSKHGEALWKIAFTRCEEVVDFVLCLKTVLSLIRSGQNDPLVLDLSPILDRCSTLTETNVYLLHSIVDYLSPGDLMTMTEIMVARILSLSVESAVLIDGGVGLLSVLSKLVAMVTSAPENEAVELLTGTLDQIMTWKEEKEDLLLYDSALSENSTSSILLNTEVARLLGAVVESMPHSLTDKHWDFIMCSLVSWIQTVEMSKEDILKSVSIQSFVVSVNDLLAQVVICVDDKAGKSSSSYPTNLVTEWTEFFSGSIYSLVLPLYLNIYKKLGINGPITGTHGPLLSAICNSVSYTPSAQILEHKLPPLLVAGDLSPLPDNIQILMNQICPLLLVEERQVQMSAYWILKRVIATLPEYDKEDKSLIVGATGGSEEEENTNRSPPSYLMKVLDESSSVMTGLLVDLPIDDSHPISVHDVEYHYAIAYLLSWKLLLHFFRSAPSELRQEYAGYFQEHGHVERLMVHIFRLMPNNPQRMFHCKPSLAVKESGSCTEIQLMACHLYQLVLKTMPAMARNWWKGQDRKTSAYVDGFTTKHVSHVLCTAEIQAVQKTEVELENMSIKARSTTREVIATYSLEEVSIEMVISLPQNYPLGNISVISEKRVGVSGPQWEKWLLQLNIFLQHQNGNIMDGLQLWKNNIDKRFEGVDECMICFYVLHGTNFQLPRITCRTCKKKFHSACLYKWFNTSHNCTCPLCRNVF